MTRSDDDTILALFNRDKSLRAAHREYVSNVEPTALQTFVNRCNRLITIKQLVKTEYGYVRAQQSEDYWQALTQLSELLQHDLPVVERLPAQYIIRVWHNHDGPTWITSAQRVLRTQSWIASSNRIEVDFGRLSRLSVMLLEQPRNAILWLNGLLDMYDPTGEKRMEWYKGFTS